MNLQQAVQDATGSNFLSLPPSLDVINAARGSSLDLVLSTSIPFAGFDLASESDIAELNLIIRKTTAATQSHWGPGSAQWLVEPSLDLPGFPFATHNPAVQLLTLKTRALQEIPTWMQLNTNDFQSRENAWKADVAVWHSVFFDYTWQYYYGIPAGWATEYMTPAESQVQADANTLFAQYVPIYDPPKDGICGSANGKSFRNAPTDLCSWGNASVVSSSDNAWHWQCMGTYGGTAVNCTARQPTVAPGDLNLKVG